MIFTDINKDNIEAFGAFIERNALYGVGAVIDNSLMNKDLARLIHRYGLVLHLPVTGFDNVEGGLSSLLENEDFHWVFENTRTDKIKLLFTPKDEQDLIHALTVSMNFPQHELWLLDSFQGHPLRFMVLEQASKIRQNEDEFRNLHSVGSLSNRYETVVPFKYCSAAKWV